MERIKSFFESFDLSSIDSNTILLVIVALAIIYLSIKITGAIFKVSIFLTVALGLFILFCIVTDREIPGYSFVQEHLGDFKGDLPNGSDFESFAPEKLKEIKGQIKGMEEKVLKNLKILEKETKSAD